MKSPDCLLWNVGVAARAHDKSQLESFFSERAQRLDCEGTEQRLGWKLGIQVSSLSLRFSMPLLLESEMYMKRCSYKVCPCM